MRIVWHVALTPDSAGRLENADPLWDAVREFAASVVRSDSEVDVRFLPRTASAMQYSPVMLANALLVVDDVRACAAAGAAGVMIAPAGEPGLDEARSAVDVPVVGSVEAALAMTQFVGRQVGVVTINEAYVGRIERNIRSYGLTSRMLPHQPVREFSMSWDSVGRSLAGEPDELLTKFDAVVQGLVRDGADVIVAGGQIFGALLARTDFVPGAVPIVDSAAAGLKMTESLVDLRHSTGLKSSDALRSPFRSVPDDELEAGYAAVFAGRDPVRR